jgi:hypothetical protein
MTDRFGGYIECPNCLEETEFFFADYAEKGFDVWTCEKCRKKFKIIMEFRGEKI